MKRILTVLLALTMTISLTACGVSRMPAKQAMTNAMDAVQKADTVTIQKYFGTVSILEGTDGTDTTTETTDAATNEEKSLTEDNLEAFVANLSYKIVSVSEKEDSAVVVIDITNKDMKSVLGKYMIAAFASAFSNMDSEKTKEETNAEYVALLTSLIDEEEGTVTITATVDMTFSDGKWTIEPNEEFANALTGGLMDAALAMSESFNGGSSDSADTSDATSGTTEMTVEDTLSEIDNWIVGDIWNNGFCEVKWYLSNGTGSTGESQDIDFTLTQFANAMEKKADYDAYMASLPEEYADIVSIYAKLSEETDALYAVVLETNMTPNSGELDCGKFTQYRDAFSEAFYAL